MKKSIYLPITIATLVLGSFVIYYVTNLVCSDIANSFYGIIDNLAIASLPGLFFSFDFVIAIIYLTRRARHPERKKRLARLYLILAFSFSVIGLVTTILSGTIVYHSFIKPYPFPGYLILCLVLHSLILVGAPLVYFLVVHKLPDDTGKMKMNGFYGFYSGFIALFLFFCMNRCGAIISLPFYVQARTLYLTWPFYVWMLLPITLLVLFGVQLLKWVKKPKKFAIASCWAVLGANFALGVAFISIALNNTQFVAAVSPCTPLSRLTSMPVDGLLAFVLMTILPILDFIYVKVVLPRREKAEKDKAKELR